MPAIKKRITAEYLEREQHGSEQNGDGEGEKASSEPTAEAAGNQGETISSQLKRKAGGTTGLLRGLDGEVLIEKRKRVLPPAEQKLDIWLENNLEKKAGSTLPLIKLYQCYTDFCQNDATSVAELEVFKTMLTNKFGKEFGLKENSQYIGVIKEAKPRKKSVVKAKAPSLGFKLKDLIQEALLASGNPSKGMVFAYIKNFISSKYPALQIGLRPHILKRVMERELFAKRIDLVKGIGFCGYYRLPGPPTIEEEPKQKKKNKVKKEGKDGEEESGEAGDESKENEGSDEAKTDDAGKSPAKAKAKTEDSKDDPDKAKDAENADAGEAAEGEAEGEAQPDKEKKPKKKTKRKQKPRKHTDYSRGTRHSNPQTINDVFPLAVTYMADPKEASYSRIKKYLEKYYGKSHSDIDSKLRKCLEQGCEDNTWGRVSGSGAGGSFQLLVDSFNPEDTESLPDMVCAAIIASNEPKTASVRLIRNYVTNYHSDFNVEARPLKLKNALERAEKNNQLRRISGIGMIGSFQLVERFLPSPAILAGNEDEEEEEEEEYEDDRGRSEVYVVRKTKSGRKSSQVERTQLDFASNYGPRRAQAGKTGRTKKKAAPKYADSSSEEESQSSDDPGSDVEAYRPQKSRSRGGPAAPPKAKTAKKGKKARPAAKKKVAAKAKSKSSSSSKRTPSRPASKQAAKEASSSEEEEEEEVLPPPSKAGRKGSAAASRGKKGPAKKSAAKKSPAKKSAAKKSEENDSESEEESSVKPSARQSAPPKKRSFQVKEESEEDEENYFEIEEAPSAKKGRSAETPKGKGSATPKSKKAAQKGGQKKAAAPGGRTPRSASTTARQSMQEASGSEEESEGEARATPAKRGKAAAPKGRSPRSASKAARRSMKEANDSDDESMEEYQARPSSSRSPRKR